MVLGLVCPVEEGEAVCPNDDVADMILAKLVPVDLAAMAAVSRYEP